MNGFKKFMSVSLASLMLAGSSAVVFAKDFEDVTLENPAAMEINILSDLGIIKGTSENAFSPDEQVTREQMALLMFRLMLNKEDAGRVNTTSFKDLYEPYYNGAISWANAAGYILGTSATEFEPTGGITLQDAMTMLVRALGQENEKMNANYPWSYINAGIKLGLDRGLESLDYTKVLTRAETAVILYNAMTSEYLIPKTTTNGNVYFESTSIIEEVFGYSMAEAVLVATNNYSMEGEPVIKNGFVTLKCTDGEGKSCQMTVPYADLDLKGTADMRIGEMFRVIYQTKDGKTTVQSAVSLTETKVFDKATLDESKNLVEIGGTNYTLVEKYSDALTTNNHELMLYAYDEDGKLELIESVSELKELLGFYRITLSFDKGAETATRGIIKVFELGKLNIDQDGKINLADNMTEKELVGGFSNDHEAKSGDHVLYYFNKENKDLEIAEVAAVIHGTVKRLTANSVKINDSTFALGNVLAGISPESIRQNLPLGAEVSAVVWQDAVVAVVSGEKHTNESQYLVAESDSQRIYENGSFKYVATVFLNGKSQNVYVSFNNVKAGTLYRYTVAGDEYTLIEAKTEDGIILSGEDRFVQTGGSVDELAYIIDQAKETTIELNGKNTYTIKNGEASANASVSGLTSVKFVTNEDTIIVINYNGKLYERVGTYNSTFTINDGANVTAILENEVGAVETLRFLYISDGSLGNYNMNAEFVRILTKVGEVVENGVHYFEYTVYNFMTGNVETRLSEKPALIIGEDYRTGADDNITAETSDHVMTGFVTGYTAGTVTVDGTTFHLADDVKIIQIADGAVKDIAIKELYMTNVDYVVENGEVKYMIAAGPAIMTATVNETTVVVTPDFDLDHFEESSLSVIQLRKGEEDLSTEGIVAKYGENNTIVITLAKAFEEGDHTITLQLGGTAFTVAIKG